MNKNDTRETNDALYLSDLWKIFASKWKMYVIVAVLAAILGGVYGFFKTNFEVTYDTVISFNLSPSDSTDALLYNLQSEMFSEKLLLEENGLPPKDQCNEKDYNAALKAIKEFEDTRAEKAELKKKLDGVQTSVEENHYNNLLKEYNRIFEVLSVYKQAAVESIADEAQHKAMIAEYEENLKLAEEELNRYFNEVYYPKMEEKLKLQTSYNLISLELKEKRTAAESAIEKVVSVWREDKDVKNKIQIINDSATYEYAKLLVPNTSEKNLDEVVDVHNKGYIKITLSVCNDEEFANLLVERYKSRVPEFVEKHMEEITGTTSAKCTLISPFSTVKEKKASSISNMIKLAVLFAIVALFFVYAICLLHYVVKRNNRKLADIANNAENDQDKTPENNH